MQQITLDLIPNGSMPVVNASQYDDGRVFRVNITENGTPYVLTDEVIEIHVRKGDGCAVTALVAYTANKSYLDIATTEQMTAVAGNNIAEINVKKNGSDIGSLNFILLVERDPLDAGVESESGIYDLQAQVNRCVQNSFDTLGAAGLPYDNTESGLEATNVQTAIDEVNAKIAEGPSDVYTKEETDALLENKADKTSVYTKTEADALLADKVSTSTLESDYYTKTETDTKLDGKANKNSVYTKTQTDALLDDKVDNSTLEDYYSSSEVDALLYQKANKNSVYTKAEINTQMAGKANVSDLANYYTKSETYSKSQTDDALASKADSADVYDKTYMDGIFEEIDNAFTGVNTALGTKADKSTTYTKTETDNALSLKADKSDTYTKAQVDTALSGKVDNATLANYYTKDEVDAKIYDVYPSIDVSPAPIASFETDIVLPLKSCKANIVASQASGTPTPSTPIPINGYDSCTVSVADENMSVQDTYTIAFGQTVYGGVLDVTRGKLHCNFVIVDIGDFNYNYDAQYNQFLTGGITNYKKPTSATMVPNALCSCFKVSSWSDTSDNIVSFFHGSQNYVSFVTNSYSDVASFKSAMSGQKLAYEVDTPFDIDLTPTEVRTLLGVNNVYNDTNGDTEVTFRETVQKYVDDKISEL